LYVLREGEEVTADQIAQEIVDRGLAMYETDGCPCGDFEIGDVGVELHCWRGSCDCCEFSGVHVFGEDRSRTELEQVGEAVIRDLRRGWPSLECNLVVEEN
jgi:hypothetical protein